MADIKDAESRSRNMAAIKSRDTKPELFIRKALFADGFRYRIAPKNIPGCPDVYLPKYKVAIFIHGCFWHRHRDCRYAYMPKSRVEFWQKKFDSNTKRDLEVRFQLREAGIRVSVIWECAIRMVCKTSDGTKELIHHIEACIRDRSSECEVEADEILKTWRDRCNRD